MLDCELRPGSQHCQKDTATFITSIIERLKRIKPGMRFLFRLDSGNDAFDTLKAIIGTIGYYCIIKRNKRKENDDEWLKTAKKHGKETSPRKGKKVWIGKVEKHPHKKGKILESVYCVFEVIERKIDNRGNRLLIPEIEVNSWWTNLKCDAETIIGLYHDHATSEQFHNELKHDLGIERLASGKMDVNKILLCIAMNAYNVLRYLGQQSLEKENRIKTRKRLGKVIRDIICVAGKLVNHAGKLVFKIYEGEPMLRLFLRLNASLCFT